MTEPPQRADPGPRSAWWLLLPALPLLLLVLVGTRGAAINQPEATAPDLLAYALAGTAALSLLLRRHQPVWGLVLCGAAMCTYFLLGYPFGPILVAGPFAVYAAVERLDLRRSVVAVGVFVVATTGSLAGHFADRGWLDLLVWAVAWSAVVITPAAIGAALRARRAAAEEVRAEQARRAVADERLRMAQEVHDVVGHGMAVIAMQAGVALHVLERNPDRARESLEAIRATSREALDGLRAELDQLRSPDASSAARRPGQGLADVPALVERIRSAGTEVTLRLDAALDDVNVPDVVDLAAYRIVQESLTNVLRHAPTAAVEVTVQRVGGELELEVADTWARGGRPRPAAAPLPPAATMEAGRDGTGIAGMQARAAVLGGSVEAGPAASGFRVRARLPLAPAAETSGEGRR